MNTYLLSVANILKCFVTFVPAGKVQVRGDSEAFQASSKMRSMRRSGSAAPHSNWSPTVNAPMYPGPIPSLLMRPTGASSVPAVFPGEGRRRGGLADAYARRLLPRVLLYVCQGLLDDADHLDLATR